MIDFAPHVFMIERRGSAFRRGQCRGGPGSSMARVLLSEFVLVGEHAVPTIDIPPGECLWRLMEKPFTYLGQLVEKSLNG